jgi:hypothetical protein
MQLAGNLLSINISAIRVQVSVIGSYASTTEAPDPFPPMAYTVPFTALAQRTLLGVGIFAFLVQVSVAGSYISSMLLVQSNPESSVGPPPIAHTFPSMTQVAKFHLGVGISAFCVQTYSTAEQTEAMLKNALTMNSVSPIFIL